MKRIIMIIMAVALIALPTMAQDWESTSSMQGSGSAYSSQVTAVGATQAANMGTTTTANQAPAKTPGGPRRAGQFDNPAEYGQGPSPLGDAVLPLMLMAMLFAGVVYTRRKKALSR